MVIYKINPKYEYLRDEILALPVRLEKEGVVIHNYRNVIKILEIGNLKVNVKSFKCPHLINRIAYAYFRKSKSERSFNYANKLTALGINTPEPIAYIVHSDLLGVTRSYYISAQLEYDFTFEQMMNQQPQEMENILKEFARFTFDFHCKGIYFLDHTPANTLIRRTADGGFEFYLVDLNRMKFMNVSPYKGLANFSKLKTTPEMTKIIATEYAACTYANPEEMTEKLTMWVEKHNESVRKKRMLKGLKLNH